MDEFKARMTYINLYPCAAGFCTNERIFHTPYLLYVHSGKGAFRIGASRYEARAGNLFYCPPGVLNTILAAQDDPFVLTGIDFECDFRDAPFEPVTDLSADIGHDLLIMEMIRAYNGPGSDASAYCNALLAAFLHNVTYYTRSGMSISDETAGILRFFAENSGVSVKIGEAGRHFNYHSSTINRRIRRAAGMSAKEYQIGTRIRKAKGLLLYSGKTVTEIAAECGYSDVCFFSRQFRLKTGFHPSEFRRRKADH